MSTGSNRDIAGTVTNLAPEVATRLRDRLVIECAHHAARANEGRAAIAELSGRNDVQSHFDREFAEVTIRRSNEAVIAVFNALLKVDAGVYGTCTCCGGPIPLDRLEANPLERCCPSCLEGSTLRPSTPAAWRQ
jgi:RNA polymerase-binding transcription factor DksA